MHQYLMISNYIDFLVFDYPIDLIEGGISFDRFEDTISLEIDHTVLESEVFYLISGLTADEEISQIISIFHHLIDTESSFITRPVTDRTCLGQIVWVFAATDGDMTFIDESLPDFGCYLSLHDLLLKQCRRYTVK